MSGGFGNIQIEGINGGTPTDQEYVDGFIASPIKVPFNLLDQMTGVTPRFALHPFYQLKSTATTPFRVKRVSDSATLDTSFTNGHLDVAELAVFCGSSDGIVVIGRDQTGNGNDVAPLSDALAPKIWDGATQNFAEFSNTYFDAGGGPGQQGGSYNGAVSGAGAAAPWHVLNGPVPGMVFDGTADTLERADNLQGFTGDPSFTFLVLGRWGTAVAGSAGLIQMGGSTVPGTHYVEMFRDSDISHLTVTGGAGFRQFLTSFNHLTTRFIIGHTSGQLISNALKCRGNGLQLAQSASGAFITLNFGNELFRIGHSNPTLQAFALQAMIVFQNDLTASGSELNLMKAEAWMKAHRTPR